MGHKRTNSYTWRYRGQCCIDNSSILEYWTVACNNSYRCAMQLRLPYKLPTRKKNVWSHSYLEHAFLVCRCKWYVYIIREKKYIYGVHKHTNVANVVIYFGIDLNSLIKEQYAELCFSCVCCCAVYVTSRYV